MLGDLIRFFRHAAESCTGIPEEPRCHCGGVAAVWRGGGSRGNGRAGSEGCASAGRESGDCEGFSGIGRSSKGGRPGGCSAAGYCCYPGRCGPIPAGGTAAGEWFPRGGDHASAFGPAGTGGDQAAGLRKVRGACRGSGHARRAIRASPSVCEGCARFEGNAGPVTCAGWKVGGAGDWAPGGEGGSSRTG